MKRTWKGAVSALFACGALAQCYAQTPSALVEGPQPRWVSDALSRLKEDGFLGGYAVGARQGAGRAEIAKAVRVALTRLNSLAPSLQGSGSLLASAAVGGGAVPIDYSRDVADIRALAKEFQPELAALLAAPSPAPVPIAIHGELDVVGLGGFSHDNTFGVTVDGRPTGVGKGADGPVNGNLDMAAHVGLGQDDTFLNEASITLTGAPQHGVAWRVTGVVGNMLDDTMGQQTIRGFGNQDDVFPGQQFLTSEEKPYLQDASVKYEGAWRSLPLRLEVGRFDQRISPYTFQRPDNTPYFANDRWDNGAWSMDGGLVRLGQGDKTLNIFFGRSSSRSGVGSDFQMQPMTAISPIAYNVGDPRPIGQMGGSQLQIDQVVAADLHWPVLKNGQFQATYVALRSDDLINIFGGAVANGVHVFGATLRATALGFIPIHASFAKSNVVFSGAPVISRDNEAIELGLTSQKGAFGLDAGYREIGPNFGAPGDWGRIGMWWNPTNIRDAYITPKFSVGPWEISAKTHLVSGLGKTSLGPDVNDSNNSEPFGSHDHDINVLLSVTRQIGDGANALIGIESANWDLPDRPGIVGGNPRERWYDFGFSYSHQNTTYSILLQISDYSNDGVGAFGPFGSDGGGFTAHGGILATQISQKY